MADDITAGDPGHQQLTLRRMAFTRDSGEFIHAMESEPAGKPAEPGAYIAGVLPRKGTRDPDSGRYRR